MNRKLRPDEENFYTIKQAYEKGLIKLKDYGEE
jgi:hypothetical protein